MTSGVYKPEAIKRIARIWCERLHTQCSPETFRKNPDMFLVDIFMELPWDPGNQTEVISTILGDEELRHFVRAFDVKFCHDRLTTTAYAEGYTSMSYRYSLERDLCAYLSIFAQAKCETRLIDELFNEWDPREDVQYA